MIKPHFTAKITLRTAEQGGRKTPADLSIYRPDAKFPFGSVYVYGVHFNHDAGWLEPGESTEVEIQIRSSASEAMCRISVGTTFLLVEGSKPVADCEVTGIYRADD